MSQGESSHLLFIGQQCHSPQCYTVDFLPFNCEHCKFSFCAEHYRPATHACDKFDAATHDRVAPPCPLCNTPVAIPPQQDPNLRMEQHIETECRVTTGKARASGSMPVCARARCEKRLFAPIKCNGCSAQFCAVHRFPSTHACVAAKPAAAAPKPAAGTGAKLVSQTSAASAAAMAAIKRNVASAPKPAPSSSAPKPAPANPKTAASTPSSSKHGNMFSKTDRRAKAEQESRRRAMKERAKKGLLSEREQLLLAEEEAALAANAAKKGSDCVVM